MNTPGTASTDTPQDTWADRARVRRELEIADAESAATGAGFNSSL